MKFYEPLNEENYKITGLNNSKNLVSDIKSKIECNFPIEIVTKENQVLGNTDIIGTGCKIRIKDNDKSIREYNCILYGDANGDGKIDSIDLLVLQRHVLEIEPLKEIYKIACNINKNGNEPSSVDLLLIQQHILELKNIKQ